MKFDHALVSVMCNCGVNVSLVLHYAREGVVVMNYYDFVVEIFD